MAQGGFFEGYNETRDSESQDALRKAQIREYQNQRGADAAAGVALTGGTYEQQPTNPFQKLLQLTGISEKPRGATLPPLEPGKKYDLPTIIERVKQLGLPPEQSMMAIQAAQKIMNPQAMIDLRQLGFGERVAHDQATEDTSKQRVGVSAGNLGERQRHDLITEGQGVERGQQGWARIGQGQERIGQGAQRIQQGDTRLQQGQEGIDLRRDQGQQRINLGQEGLDIRREQGDNSMVSRDLTNAAQMKNAGMSAEEQAAARQAALEQRDAAIKARRGAAPPQPVMPSMSSGGAPAPGRPPSPKGLGGGGQPMPGGLKPLSPKDVAFGKSVIMAHPERKNDVIQHAIKKGFDPAGLQ